MDQLQRVRMFSTPESISNAAACLAQLPSELGEILNDPRALPELAAVLLSEPEKPELSEGIITCFAEGKLTGKELNQPPWFAKYPNVLRDLASLAKAFDKLPPGELRSRLKAALGDQCHAEKGSQSGFIPSARQTNCGIRIIRQFELPLCREWQEAVPSSWGFCASSLAPSGSDA